MQDNSKKAPTPSNAVSARGDKRDGGFEPSKSGKRRANLSFGLTYTDLLQPTQTLQDAPVAARHALMVQKLRLCSIECDWHVAHADDPYVHRDKAH